MKNNVTHLEVGFDVFVSMYQNFATQIADRSLLGVLDDIKLGAFESDINSIRYALQTGEEETADEIKKGLPAFTTSGRFQNNRQSNNLVQYSHIICLDFDDIPIEHLYEVKQKVTGCPYTFAVFISPGGAGLKILVRVNSEADQHTNVYKQVMSFYENLTDHRCDPSCKDITRLCFVSFDPELYINTASKSYHLISNAATDINSAPGERKIVTHGKSTLEDCRGFTEQRQQYHEGNRNNYIHLFANNANRMGISEGDALDYCVANFDLQEHEVLTTVRNVYKTNIAQFAQFAQSPALEVLKTGKNMEYEEEEIDNAQQILNTPTIPQSVYDNLAPILFEGCNAFTEVRERDTFLTAVLGIVSGCLPNVSGEYSRDVVYPNLFSCILAPAASGKGVVRYARKLAEHYQLETVSKSNAELKEYNIKLAEYSRAAKKSEKSEGNEMPPTEPKAKVVFIPANASSASIYQHLHSNGGSGIICETEADTLGTALKSEWGSFSDIIRKSFHHEPLTLTRKTDKQYLEICDPRLSIVLSGTPNQILNIIESAEDGLFSRFLFYIFKSEPKWIDPSPCSNGSNYKAQFETLSKQVYDMVLFFQSNETRITLSNKQWKKFNPVFEQYLKRINIFVSEDAQGIVKRLGLILFRICMILTALRKFSARAEETEVQCSDIDFEIALDLVSVYLEHNTLMFQNLPKQGKQGLLRGGNNNEKLFDALPSSFTRGEAIVMGATQQMSERKVDKLLSNWVKTVLHQPRYGYYEKNAI